jgi:hypothetical protein
VGASQRAGCGDADGDGNKGRPADEATGRRPGGRVAPDLDAVGSRVEGAAREGLTAPEVLALVLVALLALIGIGSMLLALAIM